MEEYLNKKCTIEVLFHGKGLFFRARPVTKVTESHITFVDSKTDELKTFRIVDIVTIQEEGVSRDDN